MPTDPADAPIRLIQTPADMLALVAPLEDADRECAVVAFLGPDRRLLGMRHLGGDDACVTLPVRALARDALAFDATLAVLAHNHPGGDPRPSPDDIAATRRLARGLEAIGVTLLDHLVVARGGIASFAALGYL